MKQVMDEVKQICPPTKAENLEAVCMYLFLIYMIYLFFVISGPFPGSVCLRLMQGMNS